MTDRKKCHVNLRSFWKPEPSQCCSNKIAGRTKGWLWRRLWLASRSCWIWQVLHACQDWLKVATNKHFHKQLSDFPSILSSTCYSDTGFYGMDWFDAMQCCYYQVRNSSILAQNLFLFWSFLQHGYVAEPMSQEEHDTIAQYLTICAYVLNQ